MMTTIADDRSRVTLAGAPPGQKFAVQTDPSGKYTLTPIEQLKPRTVVGRVVERDGRLVMEFPEGLEVDPEGIAQAVHQSQEETSNNIVQTFTAEWERKQKRKPKPKKK